MAETPPAHSQSPPQVTTLDASWPGHALAVMPGDFSHYVPQGMGFDAPMIVRPWDDPLKVMTAGPDFYGFQAPELDPIRGAPAQDPAGGVIYFDDSVEPDALQTALSVMGVHLLEKNFVVFAGEATDSVKQRYLDQVRIMSRSGLEHMFHPGPHAAALKPQTVTAGEYIAMFIAAQKAKWSDGYAFSTRLSGSFGGDGDWAKESLCFGFLVENSYWGVYRLWSRAWLVTK
jgi:hypothetical protein